ncbi:MAG TPA: serine/threonine-protein kinase, partial [Polyangiaceae bacterium]|nr:serine/threonine-protein kinase [Polyangiaceae bacterium]
MAEVWAAQNLLTDRQFAIKLVLPSLAARPDIVERFLQEARATGRLKHPAIVDVFDVGRAEDGRPFMVMELLRGCTLDQHIRSVGTLDPLTASVLMGRVARALVVAHRAGVVHRDLSSANIFLAASRDGKPWPKILDFGVSKLMRPRDRRVRT